LVIALSGELHTLLVMAAQTVVYSSLPNFVAVLAAKSLEMSADFRNHEQALLVYRSVVHAEQIRSNADHNSVIRHW